MDWWNELRAIESIVDAIVSYCEVMLTVVWILRFCLCSSSAYDKTFIMFDTFLRFLNVEDFSTIVFLLIFDQKQTLMGLFTISSTFLSNFGSVFENRFYSTIETSYHHHVFCLGKLLKNVDDFWICPLKISSSCSNRRFHNFRFWPRFHKISIPLNIWSSGWTFRLVCLPFDHLPDFSDHKNMVNHLRVCSFQFSYSSCRIYF